jgi:hypothetical protein
LYSFGPRGSPTECLINIIWDRIYFLYIYIYQYDSTWIDENIPVLIDGDFPPEVPSNDTTRDRFLNLLLDKFKELTEQLLGPGNGFTGTFDDL